MKRIKISESLVVLVIAVILLLAATLLAIAMAIILVNLFQPAIEISRELQTLNGR